MIIHDQWCNFLYGNATLHEWIHANYVPPSFTVDGTTFVITEFTVNKNVVNHTLCGLSVVFDVAVATNKDRVQRVVVYAGCENSDMLPYYASNGRQFSTDDYRPFFDFCGRIVTDVLGL